MLTDLIREYSPVLISLLAAVELRRFLVGRKCRGHKDEMPYVCGQENASDNADTANEEPVLFNHERLSDESMATRSRNFFLMMNMRRSVRFFSRKPVPQSIVEDCIRSAGTAPSGAHCQPWHFCLVESQEVKDAIRKAVEEEEEINYKRRMGREWKDELTGIMQGLKDSAGNEWTKPYLTEAPYIIVCMKQTYVIDEEGKRVGEVRYPQESTGIACGILVAALHNAGLVTLTSTPLGAEKKLRAILDRPGNERVFLLMPVGLPASNATVPYRNPLRKSHLQLISFH